MPHDDSTPLMRPCPPVSQEAMDKAQEILNKDMPEAQTRDPIEQFVAGDADLEYSKIYGDVASSVLWWANELAKPDYPLHDKTLLEIYQDIEEPVSKRIAAARLVSACNPDLLGLKATEFICDRFLGKPKSNADPATIINILQTGKDEDSGLVLTPDTQEILDRIEHCTDWDEDADDDPDDGARCLPAGESTVHHVPSNGSTDLEGPQGESQAST
jgi:hypothetical protein